MSSSPPKWELDVFVSFKSDCVGTFTEALFKRLEQVGIGYFRDDNAQEAPGNVKPERPKVLPKVRFALVVFCESYVSSNRCLNGLVEILNCKRRNNFVVIPIYLTDRAVVSRKFAETLGQGTESEAKKKEWRNALEEAEGYHLRANSTPDESKKLIDKIVERLVNEIFSQPTEKDFGPFGVKNEKSWHSDEIENGISAVYNKDGIKSITFEVKDGTDTKLQYGRSGKDITYEVKFENEEYITSFAGYFDNASQRITGLTFRTSKRMLGPFGKTDGVYFYVPPKGGDVIEFFGGWENGFLTSIGARVRLVPKPVRPFIVQHAGLIGKVGMYKWDDGHHHENVRKIIGKGDSQSETIRSIEFEYEETDGKSWPSETHGLTDGNNFSTQRIEMGPQEHLTAISAVCEGDYIKSLEFLIGKKKIKTICVDRNNDERGATSSTDAQSNKKQIKTISIPNCIIVGFYGWSVGRGASEYLCGIGAYFQRKPIQHEDRWNDNEFFGVRKIYLWLDHKNDSTHIRGIRFVYNDRSGNVETVHHGDITAQGSCQEMKYELDYPREYLTSISGCTREDDAIKSLTFHSNRKNHPHSSSVKEEGRFFWYPSTGSRITGFYGTFDNNALQSIGVYAEAIPHIDSPATIGPFGGPEGVDWNDEVHNDVRAFRVSHDDRRIRSISFMYDDNGSLVECPQRGGGDVGKWTWLDSPNERLKSITVWKSSNANDAVISHLQITTTLRTYGPYPGKPKGKPHEDEIKLYKDGPPVRGLCYNRVGFFGRAGSNLNAIGAHFEPN